MTTTSNNTTQTSGQSTSTTVKSDQITNLLNEGKVRFSYKKEDGSIRKAFGTTNIQMIPEGERNDPNNSSTAEKVTYYDLESKGWRNFKRSAVDPSSIKKETAA